jgi:uncharacterized UBP type Zn finger protein
MGAASSRLEKALGEQFPEGERYFGLENFGNTCYCNSVLQVTPNESPPYSVHMTASCSIHGNLLVFVLYFDLGVASFRNS